MIWTSAAPCAPLYLAQVPVSRRIEFKQPQCRPQPDDAEVWNGTLVQHSRPEDRRSQQARRPQERDWSVRREARRIVDLHRDQSWRSGSSAAARPTARPEDWKTRPPGFQIARGFDRPGFEDYRKANRSSDRMSNGERASRLGASLEKKPQRATGQVRSDDLEADLVTLPEIAERQRDDRVEPRRTVQREPRRASGRNSPAAQARSEARPPCPRRQAHRRQVMRTTATARD